MPRDKLLQEAVKTPKKLFVIDGTGALISAFLLGVVLVRYQAVFGIPRTTLYFLASWPILFALYDFYSYRRGEARIGGLLKILAVMNILYCCLSMGFAYYHAGSITVLGWIYILVEVVIVSILARIEWRVGHHLFEQDQNVKTVSLEQDI